jgi:hypothetical protein
MMYLQCGLVMYVQSYKKTRNVQDPNSGIRMSNFHFQWLTFTVSEPDNVTVVCMFLNQRH